MEIREMRAFVAVVEEGALSAAARRLHLSQPALSQRIQSLERHLGLRLLTRGSTGVSPTEAGLVLLDEARRVLAAHDRAVAALAAVPERAGNLLRVGVPLELPPGVLSRALAALAVAHPDTHVQARHLSTAAQLDALRAEELELGLLREHPIGHDLDATLVVTEPLGVLLSAEAAQRLSGPDGVRLDALAGLDWLGFPRAGSPAWYDELTAVLRSHGLDLGTAAGGQDLVGEVKVATVSAGRHFTLAPPHWCQGLPDTVRWRPLAGRPLCRRTWAVWPAHSRRRDLGFLVAAMEPDDAAAQSAAAGSFSSGRAAGPPSEPSSSGSSSSGLSSGSPA